MGDCHVFVGRSVTPRCWRQERANNQLHTSIASSKAHCERVAILFTIVLRVINRSTYLAITLAVRGQNLARSATEIRIRLSNWPG